MTDSDVALHCYGHCEVDRACQTFTFQNINEKKNFQYDLVDFDTILYWSLTGLKGTMSHENVTYLS